MSAISAISAAARFIKGLRQLCVHVDPERDPSTGGALLRLVLPGVLDVGSTLRGVQKCLGYGSNLVPKKMGQNCRLL